MVEKELLLMVDKDLIQLDKILHIDKIRIYDTILSYIPCRTSN